MDFPAAVETAMLALSLAISTSSLVYCLISAIYFSGASFPLSISYSFFSHSPVNSGLFSFSGMISSRAIPFGVG